MILPQLLFLLEKLEHRVVVLTSGDKHKTDLAIIDFDPKDLQGNPQSGNKRRNESRNQTRN